MASRITSTILLAATLSQLVQDCNKDPVYVMNALVEAPPASKCVTISSAQYRQTVKSFVPAPGYSYPWSQVDISSCGEIAPLLKDGRVINRVLFRVDTGLEFVLLREHDRVIGFELMPTY